MYIIQLIDKKNSASWHLKTICPDTTQLVLRPCLDSLIFNAQNILHNIGFESEKGEVEESITAELTTKGFKNILDDEYGPDLFFLGCETKINSIYLQINPIDDTCQELCQTIGFLDDDTQTTSNTNDLFIKIFLKSKNFTAIKKSLGSQKFDSFEVSLFGLTGLYSNEVPSNRAHKIYLLINDYVEFIHRDDDCNIDLTTLGNVSKFYISVTQSIDTSNHTSSVKEMSTKINNLKKHPSKWKTILSKFHYKHSDT